LKALVWEAVSYVVQSKIARGSPNSTPPLFSARIHKTLPETGSQKPGDPLMRAEVFAFADSIFFAMWNFGLLASSDSGNTFEIAKHSKNLIPSYIDRVFGCKSMYKIIIH
jgi:hypothetical protein